MQRDDAPELSLAIEKLDDVSIHAAPADGNVPTELRQYKLHVSRQGNLGDKSPDVWKTLRIWAEAVRTRRVDLDRVHLCLVTTSLATDQNAVRLLRSDAAVRDPEKARQALEEAGGASKNDVVKEAFQALMLLDEGQRQKLFRAVHLLDNGLAATDVRRAIGRCVWAACIEKHRETFADRLEGWWVNLVVHHLSQTNPDPIPIHVVQSKVHEIAAFYRRECLPDELIGAPVPDAALATDQATFVGQLYLIGISPARLRLALEDHYRAFTQRSRWAKEQLLGFDEEVRYEARLVAGWKERFLIMVEGIVAGCDDPTLAGHGAKFYDWFGTEAPSRSTLWFRPDFQSEYMTKGSFHMLADQLRVGWHPQYESRLAPPPAPPPKPARKRKGAAT